MSSHQKGTLNLNNRAKGYWFTVNESNGMVLDRWTTIMPYTKYQCPNCKRTVDLTQRNRRDTECKICNVQMKAIDWYPEWHKLIDREEERKIYLSALRKHG